MAILRQVHPDWPAETVESQARYWCLVQRQLERDELNADRRFYRKQRPWANPEQAP
jgi:hypothetical protein